MILDKQEFYLTSAGSSVLGGGSSANSEYRDTGVAAQFDNAHRKQFVNLRCIVGQAGTSPTLAITLKGGTDGSTFGTTVLTLHATAILNAGTVYKVPLPANMPRYTRVEYTVGGTQTANTGTFEVFLSQS